MNLTIESNKTKNEFINEYKRLVTFKNNNTLLINVPKTILAKYGFIFDTQINQLKCSSCQFFYTSRIIESLFDLIRYHIEYLDENNINCEFKDQQTDFLHSFKIDRNRLKEKPNKKYETEEGRKESFLNCEIEIDVQKLIENGFFLIQDNSLTLNTRKIKCYFCDYECIIFRKGQLNGSYAIPFEEHEIKSPNCEIFLKNKKNNNEIDGFKNDNIFLKNIIKNNENNTITSIQYNMNGNSNFDLLKNVLNKSMNATCDKPFHPGYAIEQSRINSFREWPINLAQQPLDLAKAGFYYYGIKDMVKCFYCNGGLRNWDPIDEPIVEHARWFPKCPYIRQLKGPSFIEEIRERYKDMDNGFKDDFDDTPQYYDVVSNNNNNSQLGNVGDNKIRKRSIVSNKNDEIDSDIDLLKTKSMNATCETPLNPGYSIEQSRIDTSREWPFNLSIKPLDLAKACLYCYCTKDMNKNNNLQLGNVGDNKIRKRSISPRTINSRMDLPSIQKLIKLGFSRNSIKQVIENKLSEDGNDFKSNVDLLKSCYELEEKSKNIEKQFQEAFHIYISNISMDITYEKVCEVFEKLFKIKPLLINKIIDSNNTLFGTLLIRLKDEDIKYCDKIVFELNEKPIPLAKSNIKIIVKKTNENETNSKNNQNILTQINDWFDFIEYDVEN